MMNITLTGSIPSKKNSKQIYINRDTGKPMIMPSNAYQTWHDDAMWQIASWRNKQPMAIRNRLPLQKCRGWVTIFTKDSRKADLTNKAESVMDLLVDAKIIDDDNLFVLSALTLEFGGVDEKKPRAEIILMYE